MPPLIMPSRRISRFTSLMKRPSVSYLYNISYEYEDAFASQSSSLQHFRHIHIRHEYTSLISHICQCFSLITSRHCVSSCRYLSLIHNNGIYRRNTISHRNGQPSIIPLTTTLQRGRHTAGAVLECCFIAMHMIQVVIVLHTTWRP